MKGLTGTRQRITLSKANVYKTNTNEKSAGMNWDQCPETTRDWVICDLSELNTALIAD